MFRICDNTYPKLNIRNNKILYYKDKDKDDIWYTLPSTSGFYPHVVFLEDWEYNWSDFEKDNVNFTKNQGGHSNF